MTIGEQELKFTYRSSLIEHIVNNFSLRNAYDCIQSVKLEGIDKYPAKMTVSIEGLDMSKTIDFPTVQIKKRALELQALDK